MLLAIRGELQAWRNGNDYPSIIQYPTAIQRAILQQWQLGWKLFLEGITSQQWQTYMTSYYRGKRSNKNALLWASRLHKYTCELIQTVWEEGNSQLHHTQRIHDMEGVPILQSAIRAEYAKGIGRLPAAEFSHHFRLPIDQMLQTNIDTQKTWLQIIRQTRILMDSSHLIEDEFTTSRALQQWINISYTLTDAEAIPTLHEAITAEYEIGLSKLPKHYSVYFKDSLSSTLTKSLPQLKQWLHRVKEGREQYDKGNILLDEFSYPGALRDWAGL